MISRVPSPPVRLGWPPFVTGSNGFGEVERLRCFTGDSVLSGSVFSLSALCLDHRPYFPPLFSCKIGAKYVELARASSKMPPRKQKRKAVGRYSFIPSFDRFANLPCRDYRRRRIYRDQEGPRSTEQESFVYYYQCRRRYP